MKDDLKEVREIKRNRTRDGTLQMIYLLVGMEFSGFSVARVAGSPRWIALFNYEDY